MKSDLARYYFRVKKFIIDCCLAFPGGEGRLAVGGLLSVFLVGDSFFFFPASAFGAGVSSSSTSQVTNSFFVTNIKE